MQPGDVITQVNGQPILSTNLSDTAGKDVKLTVTRGGEQLELTMKVGTREFTAFSLAETPNATPQQLRVREGWLKR